jgi:hypothetical protein
VHGVPVEVASGAVDVPGGTAVGTAGEDPRVAKGTPASGALVIAACRRECGLMCRGMPAAFTSSPRPVEAAVQGRSRRRA